MQICFLRVLPQIVSHHIILIILSFWQENTHFLVADSALRMKIQIPLFLETSFDIFNRRKLYESKSLIMKTCLFYSSRNLRRARCQTVVGYNEDNQPYHHTRMYILCISIQCKYTINKQSSPFIFSDNITCFIFIAFLDVLVEKSVYFHIFTSLGLLTPTHP